MYRPEHFAQPARSRVVCVNADRVLKVRAVVSMQATEEAAKLSCVSSWHMTNCFQYFFLKMSSQAGN